MSKNARKESKIDPKDLKAAQDAAKAAEAKARIPNPFGLSFKADGRGFNLAADSFLVAQEMFTVLFEKFDEEMMKKKVEREYKRYSIQNSIQFSLHAINISNLKNDVGDNFTEYPIYDFDHYDYEEESTEPAPTPMDSHAKHGKLNEPAKLRFRLGVDKQTDQLSPAKRRASPEKKSVSFARRGSVALVPLSAKNLKAS